MNHADLIFESVFRRPDQNLFAVDKDMTGIRKINPGYHIHQRRLSAAVLAENRKNLAAVDGQIDALVGNDFAEGFCDISEFDGGNRRTGYSRSRCRYGWCGLLAHDENLLQGKPAEAGVNR